MKSLIVVLFMLLFNNYSHAQENRFGNLWGVYFIDYDPRISLNICELNRWFFTTCTIQGIPVHEVGNNCDIIFEAEGDIIFKDSILYLKDKNDTLFLSFKIVDTLNLQVIYATDFLNKGDYLNRSMSFFPGHSCGSYLHNLEIIRWEISDNKLYRYNSLGGFFDSKAYVIHKLPDGYWKKNEVEK